MFLVYDGINNFNQGYSEYYYTVLSSHLIGYGFEFHSKYVCTILCAPSFRPLLPPYIVTRLSLAARDTSDISMLASMQIHYTKCPIASASEKSAESWGCGSGFWFLRQCPGWSQQPPGSPYATIPMLPPLLPPANSSGIHRDAHAVGFS